MGCVTSSVDGCEAKAFREMDLIVPQGNTSETVRLSLVGYPDVSSDNWTGTVKIKEFINSDTNILNRTLQKSFNSSEFVLVLTSEETELLPVGRLRLYVEVSNVLDYQRAIKRRVVDGTIQILKN